MKLSRTVLISSLGVAMAAAAGAQTPVGTAFTYQGRLIESGAPASGLYDMQFTLFDAPAAGNTVGAPVVVTNLGVAAGLFVAPLEFGGGVFGGIARWLEIGVRPGGTGGVFTLLTPRQELTPTPNALFSSEATTAASFSGSLAGDVTGTQGATVVSSVGGQTASSVASGAAAANAATAASTPNSIVRRDAAGSFAANAETLAGNLNLAHTTAGVGLVTKGGQRFLHDSGVSNTFLGASSGNLGLTGTSNTAFGESTLSLLTSGSENTAAGALALSANAIGSQNSAFGASALASNTAGNNSAFGAGALASNMTGGYNSAFGAYALNANVAHNSNSAFGSGALSSNTATGNSAFGESALLSNTTSINNAAFGIGALQANTTAGNNSAFGAQALTSSTGGDNTAFGFNALFATTTGANNIAIGHGAGDSLTTGSDNIYLGADAAVGGESSTIRIGGALQNRVFVTGIFGQPSASGATVLINSFGRLGTVLSSRRYKTGIQDMGAVSRALLRLRPVAFRYRPDLDASGSRQFGLVAEEVAEVLPELVVYGKDGEPETVRYDVLPALLLNELKNEHAVNEEQRQVIEAQRLRIDELEGRLRRLESARPR